MISGSSLTSAGSICTSNFSTLEHGALRIGFLRLSQYKQNLSQDLPLIVSRALKRRLGIPEDHGCLIHLDHGHAAGLCGSYPSPAWLERWESTKREEQPRRAVRQRLEAHRGVEAMQTSLILFPALRRHVQEQQPHTQNLPHLQANRLCQWHGH